MSTLTSIMSTLPASARPKRPHLVWGTLTLAMTTVAGAMMLLEDKPSALATPIAAAVEPLSGATQNLLASEVPLDHERWTGIVIHHSGSVMGSADTIAKQHEAAGLKGLGYHFVIGNGQGAPDGQITAGPRWGQQQPGAHTKGPQGETYNRRTIGICLVGDGDSRPFTMAQQASLVRLVQQLQKEFNIPSSQVVLHRDVASTASPGRLFPEAAFRAGLNGR